MHEYEHLLLHHLRERELRREAQQSHLRREVLNGKLRIIPMLRSSAARLWLALRTFRPAPRQTDAPCPQLPCPDMP
ncbi:MAG: hypothetical protein IAE80_16630 [Anaerolinea sp.]|nr:hypothetical protein [Anaerolinea sp.]